MDFAEIEKGNVKFIHHSTSSIIEIQIKTKEEVTQGGKEEEVISKILIDYNTFDNLKEIFNNNRLEL